MYKERTNKTIKILSITLVIVLLIVLIILAYSILRGLNRNSVAFETIYNSDKAWICEEINMVLYSRKTDEFKKIEQQYNFNDLSYNMLGYFKYNNITYTIIFIPQVSDEFSIIKADDFDTVVDGSYGLTLLGFGNNIKLKKLKFKNEFCEISAKKLIFK